MEGADLNFKLRDPCARGVDVPVLVLALHIIKHVSVVPLLVCVVELNFDM